MKIRNSFVSNSSSCSYIVTVPCMVMTEDVFWDRVCAALQLWSIKEKDKKKVALKIIKDLDITYYGGARTGHVLRSFTSMHNSYRDMSEEHKNMYLELSEESHLVTLKREGDH